MLYQIYEDRVTAERFITDKARTASILNGFKNDPLHSDTTCEFICEEIFSIDVV